MRLCEPVRVAAELQKCDDYCKVFSNVQVQQSHHIFRGAEWKVLGASGGVPPNMGLM